MKNYQLRRLSDQPILQTSDVKPAIAGFEVLGAFNPAACWVDGEILLLLRVAEAPKPEKGFLTIPLIEDQDGVPVLTIRRFAKPDEDHDPRVVTIEGKQYLTSLSHLRLARSRDGLHFEIEDKPFLFPARMDESYGIEDARITFLEGQYWITYTAVSEHGPAVGLAVTTDFQTPPTVVRPSAEPPGGTAPVERLGLILPPPNKDVALFPEKVGGNYLMLHRPMVSDIGKPSVWLAESPDGIHWGNHRFLFGGRGLTDPKFSWEGGKIGGGPQPLLTDEGWLVCYHGADADHAYALALALLDRDDPTIVLGRSEVPLLTPELSWEREGFFPNVVFSNGWVQWPDGRIWVYYGAADSGVGVAELVRV